jgi:cell division protein FtsI (penicillin-binding protein 3)
VVIDTPTAGGDAQHYGGAVSAPVFAEVAQQVLEYLGVPHDQPLKTKKQMQQIVAQRDSFADGPSENGADINALFSEVNNLPADDPLRAPANAAAAAAPAPAPAADGGKGAKNTKGSGMADLIPEKVLAAFRAKSDGTAEMQEEKLAAAAAPKAGPALAHGAVMVSSGQSVAVPEFLGAALRSVVERAGGAGLRVQPVGSGLAREQVPAAGTMVPMGTEVVVRFSR